MVSYFCCKQKMTTFRGQASWAKMMSPGGQVNSIGEPISTNIGCRLVISVVNKKWCHLGDRLAGQKWCYLVGQANSIG